MAKRVVIVVSGGCVQSVLSDNPDAVSIEVIDCDNLVDTVGWTEERVDDYIEKQTIGLFEY